jgi:hypothetical protein
MNEPVQRPRLALLLVAATALLTGCFTTSADYKRDAEKYVDSAVADVLEVDFVSVECEEPRTQDVGEHFPCNAVDSDGGEWVFDLEITGKHEFTVNLDRSPD